MLFRIYISYCVIYNSERCSRRFAGISNREQGADILHEGATKPAKNIVSNGQGPGTVALPIPGIKSHIPTATLARSINFKARRSDLCLRALCLEIREWRPSRVVVILGRDICPRGELGHTRVSISALQVEMRLDIEKLVTASRRFSIAVSLSVEKNNDHVPIFKPQGWHTEIGNGALDKL